MGMLRLQPINTIQTIKIMPRSVVFDVDNISMRLTEEQTNVDTLIENSTGNTLINAVQNGNYIELSFSFDFNNEDSMFVLELSLSNELWYRDKIYVTSSLSTEDYHKIINTDYIQRNTDNEYITL